VTLDEAKDIVLVGLDGESSDLRAAIEALPDRVRLDRLDDLSRALVETRLHQLVTVGIVPQCEGGPW